MKIEEPVPSDYPTSLWRESAREEIRRQTWRELMLLSGPTLRAGGLSIGLLALVSWAHSVILPGSRLGLDLTWMGRIEVGLGIALVVMFGWALFHGMTLQARLSARLRAVDQAEPRRRDVQATFGPTGTRELRQLVTLRPRGRGPTGTRELQA